MPGTVSSPQTIKAYIDSVKSKLRQAFENSQRRINLLNTIRARANRTATKEELIQLNERPGDYVVEPLDKEIIALILDIKAENRRTKNHKYEPWIIDTTDLVTEWALNKKISECTNNTQPFHYDFILKRGPHCSATQIDFDGENLRVFFVDASPDPRNLNYALSFKTNHQPAENYLFSKGGIQFDETSCSIFGIQDLNSLSKLALEERMKIKDSPLPEGVPAVFIKNIQRPSNLDQYFRGNTENTIDKKRTKTLKDHLEDYSITVDVSKAGDGSNMKDLNFSIDYKKHKYLQAALNKLEQLNEIEAEQLINSRCNLSGKDTYTTKDDSSFKTDMIKAVVDNRDQKRIEELTRYAIGWITPLAMTELVSSEIDLNKPIKEYDSPMWNNKITPISRIIAGGHCELTKKILTKAIDKTRDQLGVPYLHHALSRDRYNVIEMVTLLVAQGADINAKDSLGNTVLHECVKIKNVELTLLNKLLELGANVNATNNEGKSPIQMAKNPEVRQILIDHTAEINNQDKQRKSPSPTFNFGIYKKLIERNQDDLDQTDTSGKKPH